MQLIQQLFAAGLPSRTIVHLLLPCVDAGRATPESFALLVTERDRITAQLAELEAARDRLDEVIADLGAPDARALPGHREPAPAAA